MILLDYKGHLVSTKSEEELHEFAHKLGMYKIWYQDHNDHPHYDLTSKKMRQKAQDFGAELTTARDILCRAWWAKEPK